MITAFSPLLSTKAYRYSTLMPFLDSTSRMLWSPPGRSGTSTATTVVRLNRKPFSFRTRFAISTSFTISRRMPKSVVSASDRVLMLIWASFRMRVTSSRPPGLFSRNMEICSTFIDEPPFMTCSPVIPLAGVFPKSIRYDVCPAPGSPCPRTAGAIWVPPASPWRRRPSNP